MFFTNFKFLIISYAASNLQTIKVNLKPDKGDPSWESKSQQSAFNLVSVRTTETESADSMKFIVKSYIQNCGDDITQ